MQKRPVKGGLQYVLYGGTKSYCYVLSCRHWGTYGFQRIFLALQESMEAGNSNVCLSDASSTPKLFNEIVLSLVAHVKSKALKTKVLPLMKLVPRDCRRPFIDCLCSGGR
ncbi:hypothetical protein SUGI_0685110 [Cryptomeria japonica]|nr:hypothetical protein SUGI_0685110 [Cryptomeria japonica]